MQALYKDKSDPYRHSKTFDYYLGVCKDLIIMRQSYDRHSHHLSLSNAPWNVLYLVHEVDYVGPGMNNYWTMFG